MERRREARLVSDIHSPFCAQVIRAGHRPTGQRTVGKRSLVPGHRGIRHVRRNTIMSLEPRGRAKRERACRYLHPAKRA